MRRLGAWRQVGRGGPAFDGARRRVNPHSLLCFVLVIIDEHGMLPGLLSNFLQGLLDVLCSGCHPIQFTLVSLVELVAILLHGSLLGVEGLKLAKEGGNGQQITQKLQTRHMIFFLF